ncbi:serine protease grass-like [Drosophila kikkawai]|uniref:Serine protease grass-like n=1 Tax=Drosophila kikkawai TaxID=30033 RepID=A0A6P4IX97_DROKI|nr:serine protease grass-like [Drosophila kikkawai]
MNGLLVIFAGFIFYQITPIRAEIPTLTPRENIVYQKLKKLDCGTLSNAIPVQRLRHRVTNGRRVSLMSQPWMALLFIPGDMDACRCGGTLISERFVLTAAHCIKLCNNSNALRVRLGEHNITSSEDCISADQKQLCAPPVEDFEIDQTVIHERFSPFYHGYDIALLRLSQGVVFKDHIRPICLPLTAELLEYTTVLGQSYLAMGWGQTEELRLADTLMEVYVNTEQCSADTHESFLCTNGDIQDTCKGDSGGPLAWQSLYFGSARRQVQFGITSWGSWPCGRGLKAYYTNVTTFMFWIIEKLAEFPNL